MNKIKDKLVKLKIMKKQLIDVKLVPTGYKDLAYVREIYKYKWWFEK